MNKKQFFKKEMQRRVSLVENEEFRKSCLKIAQKMGISQKEWEENKAFFWLYFANEVCKYENENGK